jgi:hypothetical protein
VLGESEGAGQVALVHHGHGRLDGIGPDEHRRVGSVLESSAGALEPARRHGVLTAKGHEVIGEADGDPGGGFRVVTTAVQPVRPLPGGDRRVGVVEP